MENRYPPAPWTVRAEMHGAVLKMPPGSIPEDMLPADSEVAFLRRGRPVRHIAMLDVTGRFGVDSVDRPPAALSPGRSEKLR